MFESHVWCYLWDLVDEGIDDVLDRLQGEAGVTGISVAVNYHSINQVRAHHGLQPRIFRSAGGAQFQGEPSLYANTRMRPVTAEWLRKRNPLAAVSDACIKRNLKLRGWLVGTHGSTAVSRYPQSAVRNVFGDQHPTCLCPVNPDVREYLRAMTEDLSQHYLFDTLELEHVSFPSSPHAHEHEKIGCDLGQVGRWLINLCFCESCRQTMSREGIDAEGAARAALSALEGVLSADQPIASTSVPEFLNINPPLADMAAWRFRQITSLIQSIRSTCKCRLVVLQQTDRLRSATDFRAIAEYCDAQMVLFYRADVNGLRDAVVSAVEETGAVSRVEVGLTACSPVCPNYDTLVATLKKLVDMGVRSANIYNYGLLPLSRLEWIRRAVRFARRESTE